MRIHPITSEQIAIAAGGLGDLAPVLRAEHERWDGRGYPDGLPGERTPLGSRIISVCAAYVAMCSERSYRPARDRGEAFAELRLEAGRQFDPVVVEALLSELDEPSAGPAGKPAEENEPDPGTAQGVAGRLLRLLAEGTTAQPGPKDAARDRAWPGNR
jgi:HD-GYP domain-containing protein (c-di-GMP phosphodiesterase class II)